MAVRAQKRRFIQPVAMGPLSPNVPDPACTSNQGRVCRPLPGAVPSGDGRSLCACGGCMRVVVLIAGLICLVGCTRAHYRLSADREVYPILGERAADAGFATDRLQ